MSSFYTSKTLKRGRSQVSCVLSKKTSFFFVSLNVTSCPSAIVSVNFAVCWRRGENHHGQGSQFKSSQFFCGVFPPFFGMRNRRRHRANLRPIVGPAIVASMKAAFKSLFLLNCFASAFQRGIFSSALHKTISGDETLVYRSFKSR